MTCAAGIPCKPVLVCRLVGGPTAAPPCSPWNFYSLLLYGGALALSARDGLLPYRYRRQLPEPPTGSRITERAAMSSKRHEIDPQYGTLFLAGEYVPAGIYRNVRNGREVHLNEGGILPPSFDGSVAVYAVAPRTWAGLTQRHSNRHPPNRSMGIVLPARRRPISSRQCARTDPGADRSGKSGGAENFSAPPLLSAVLFAAAG